MTCRSQCLPSTAWAPGIELRLSGQAEPSCQPVEHLFMCSVALWNKSVQVLAWFVNWVFAPSHVVILPCLRSHPSLGS